MIEMWDDIFTKQNKRIGEALRANNGRIAFELMNKELDKVWNEVHRVLKTGGIACINIGDATRTIDGRFSLYTNHSRIHTHMQQIGFSALPAILWRKQTNAPNKFMGSGMMPPGAYVTLEHEYILILRKGNKKEFKSNSEKQTRRESSFFWEERNNWFSDIWMDLKGTSQNLFDTKSRNRSAAYPFELPYRLISMFSIKGDTILDPFLGIGTSMYAAIAAGRNSIGYEIDSDLQTFIKSQMSGIVAFSNKRINERLTKHCDFVDNYLAQKGSLKHLNTKYLFPVMTKQETEILLNEVISVMNLDSGEIETQYSDEPQATFDGRWDNAAKSRALNDEKNNFRSQRNAKVLPDQQTMFNFE